MYTIDRQLELFRRGFPWLKIVAPATPGHGIHVLSEQQAEAARQYADSATTHGRCKFVPASGAASRMFKDIFAGLEKPNEAVERLRSEIEKFAFWDPALFAGRDAAETVLSQDGLGYGSKPKGVIRFHRYGDECRTAFAEHLVEGQAYMRDTDGTVNIEFTISPNHRPLFEQALEEVRAEYEKRYGVRYNVRFSYQDPQTDTVAVDEHGKPFLKADGSILRRPAGHGALIYNLNALEEELVSIKNIDNVASERFLPTIAAWKKTLMGCCLELRDRIFGYIYALDQFAAAQALNLWPGMPGFTPLERDPYANDEAQELCNEIEDFLRNELCISVPETRSCRARAEALRKLLDRPIRVCGMVRNQGEPGGGPFIIEARDGTTSLQILEGSQINPDDPEAQAALKSATHFNPVDLVCCLHDHEGRKFDLTRFVDPDTGFISSKSYEGRPLKALELPGLWNGSMSAWNTMFVEVPLETFNPVKTVLDLLRPAHQ